MADGKAYCHAVRLVLKSIDALRKAVRHGTDAQFATPFTG